MALDKRDCVEIPQPPGLPLIGNVLELGGESPLSNVANLGQKYGEIFSLQVLNRKVVFISSQAMMNEICDEKRFGKTVQASLKELREGVHDGLFTANNEEVNWQVAHRTLTPAFGPLAIASMFDSMKDIASQLVLKWARFGESYRIPASEDFTRLTLDTLALCAMDYRFNSFYTDETHPFITSMMHFLIHANVRARTPVLLRPLYRAAEAKWWQSIEYMRKLAGEVVHNRIKNPKDEKDLLNAMVMGKDPKTGRGLTDESIIDNTITFLVAGHETTSGMLSFIMQYLLKNENAYRRVQQEVDEVVGIDSVQPEHLSKLPYITAVLREALRLMPTAPGFTVTPKNPQGEVIGGKYHIAAGQSIVAILHNVHRDPAVYGEDAEEFRPERMLDEKFDDYAPSSWKPFGNGSRGCIGRSFAWQEMLLVITMLFQYFEFSLDDPAYELKVVFTLTIKPKDFYMRARLRPGYSATSVEQSLSGSGTGRPNKANKQDAVSAGVNNDSSAEGKPMTILYGSNSGTCEAFARTLAADAAFHGFSASRVTDLDSAKANLPLDEPIVIVTASYEGEPTDDATHFYEWLKKLHPDEKLKTKFAVFGCGHSDWKQTHHAVPLAIDRLLEEHGGERLCQIGLADAAKGDMMSDFQTWEDTLFWPACKQFDTGASGKERRGSIHLNQGLTVEVSNKRALHLLRSDFLEAKVVASKTLSSYRGAFPEKKHIELQLPSGTSYRSGDYCAVLPLNPRSTVHRVLLRFGLPWDAMLTISSKTGTRLPTDHPISAQDLFGAYLEISQPATRRNISMLIEASDDVRVKKELQAILDDDFSAAIIDKRVSLLDLLERYPSISLPLGSFIGSLISMRVRQYSISSSPLSHPNKVILTYSVLDEPSISGQGRHVGVASNYLSSLQPGDIAHVTIKPSHQSFHLPSDAENTPVIMIAAGTGIAPFRGFIQERAAQIGSGRTLAPAVLYFGCRDPKHDDLYREELDFWEKMGAVTTHRAYSRACEQSQGNKHIDETLLAHKESLIELWDRGAKVYVCGSRGLGESAKKACLQIAKERAKSLGKDDSDERLDAWFDGIRNDRYTTDVFT